MTAWSSNRELPIKRVDTTTSGGGRRTARKPRRMTIDEEPIPTPDELRAWHDVQVPYTNLAGADADRDDKAAGFVRDLVRKFQIENRVIYEKWRIIRRLLDSMRSGPGEGEVAELYKALERMIPRIEEQVLGYPVWFQTHGREESDKKQIDVITAFLSWQLEQDKFRTSVQPAIRTMLAYGFAAEKTWWETKTDRRFKREVNRVKKNGKDQLDVNLIEEDRVVFNGPRARLIDPFDFFIDTNAIRVEDALFIGDMTRMTYEEIAGAGCYQNFEALKEMPTHERFDYTEWYKRERSPQRHSKDHRKVEGLPNNYYVTEIWCPYDLYGNGEMVECVVTVANFNTVIRLQENFHDDKHRPYAVSRANREAFDFFAVGPLDNAIQSQMSINQHRALALRSHKLSLAPWIFADDEQDLPDSLWDIKVGSIVRVANPAGIKDVSVKSTMGEARYSESILREDIEETTGSTRMLGGTENSDTATESTQKLSESSRRVRSYVQSYAMMQNDKLAQFHSLNGQYVMRAQKFRVLGKKAKGLRAYEQVDPEVLQTEVDFTFTALASMHSSELRATQLMSFMNLAAPIIAKYPGRIDEIRIMWQLFRDMAGGTLDPDEIIPLPTNPELLVSQEEENIMLMQGQAVEVDMDDDHEEHLAALEALQPFLSKMPGSVRMNFLDHTQKHLDYVRQAAEQAKKQAGGGLTPFQAPAQDLDANRGTTGRQQMPGDENGLKSAPMGMGYSPGQTQGETPGQPRLGATPAADRVSGVFQQDNQRTG